MIKKIFIITLLASFMGLVTPITSLAAENPLNSACSNLTNDQKKTSAACEKDLVKEGEDGNVINPISGGTDSILYKITLLISILAGAIAVIIIIIAGISMITSSGDSQKLSNARNTIIFAIVGIIIIVLAQALITFIITQFGG